MPEGYNMNYDDHDHDQNTHHGDAEDDDDGHGYANDGSDHGEHGSFEVFGSHHHR